MTNHQLYLLISNLFLIASFISNKNDGILLVISFIWLMLSILSLIFK